MMPSLEQQFWAMAPEHRRPEKREMLRAIVAAERVVPELRAAVDAALRIALRELELFGVVIRWLAPPGFARPGDVRMAVPAGREAFVEPAVRPRDVFLSAFARTPVQTVLHEARHLWQFQHGAIPAPTACPDAGCSDQVYALTAEEEDRMELDAFVWAGTTMRELALVEYRHCRPRGLVA